MGMTLLFMIFMFKEVGKRSKRFAFLRALGPFTACVIGIAAVYIGDLSAKNIKIIALIPAVGWGGVVTMVAVAWDGGCGGSLQQRWQRLHGRNSELRVLRSLRSFLLSVACPPSPPPLRRACQALRWAGGRPSTSRASGKRCAEQLA